MGKCARRTKKIIKVIGKSLTPVGVGLIGNIVGLIAGTDWSNSEKRERAVDMAKAALREASITAKETAIRTVVEVSVAALKQGTDALADLGQLDVADAQEIESLD